MTKADYYKIMELVREYGKKEKHSQESDILFESIAKEVVKHVDYNTKDSFN